MSDQLKAATVRALYAAILTAALTFVTTLQTQGPEDPRRMEIAALAALATFFGIMVTRGAAEGLIDSSRNANGQVSRADVGGDALLGPRGG